MVLTLARDLHACMRASDERTEPDEAEAKIEAVDSKRAGLCDRVGPRGDGD